MDLSAFQIQYFHKNKMQSIEVRPCCKEDDVLYYDIWNDNIYQFTITPGLSNDVGAGWRLALKNADKPVENELIQKIGLEIERHYS